MKKIYKSVYTVTVLSSEPMCQGVDLNELDYEMTEGSLLGQTKEIELNQEITGAAEILQAQEDLGSDGSFFREDEDSDNG